VPCFTRQGNGQDFPTLQGKNHPLSSRRFLFFSLGRPVEADAGGHFPFFFFLFPEAKEALTNLGSVCLRSRFQLPSITSANELLLLFYFLLHLSRDRTRFFSFFFFRHRLHSAHLLFFSRGAGLHERAFSLFPPLPRPPRSFDAAGWAGFPLSPRRNEGSSPWRPRIVWWVLGFFSHRSVSCQAVLRLGRNRRGIEKNWFQPCLAALSPCFRANITPIFSPV